MNDIIKVGILILGVFVIVMVGAFFLVTSPTIADICLTYPDAILYGLHTDETIVCSKYHNVTLQ
jgi:hypothetical protein